jgi:glutaminyl-tRNA synthetase
VSIRNFCQTIGVAKFNSTIDMVVLENAVREHLNRVAPRVMGVLRPLKVVITNFSEGEVEHHTAINNPEDEAAGTREIPFSRELFIERTDFMEDPPKKFFRLAPGREVRLRYAYFLKCEQVIKDESGEIVELHCTYDPETKGGQAPDGRKVKGTIHWVSAPHAVAAEVRLYDHLFQTPHPDESESGKTWLDNLNPHSLEVVQAMLEPSLANPQPAERFQFERHGYFCVDTVDSTAGAAVFNRTVSLRDSWAKIQKKT